MKILLLGCTGFIGSELVPNLLKSDHDLSIVSRKQISNQKFINSKNKITYITCDPSQASSWEREELLYALKNAEGVINLVGEPIAEKRWSQQHCQEIRNSRLNTTKNLIKAISSEGSNIKVLLQGSAIGFYGTSPTETFDEQSPSGKDFLATLCEKWEEIASKKPQRTRLVIIRTGIVLEKNGGALGKMLPVFRMGLGGPIGNGMQWMSWIHRKDLCQMIENALTQKKWVGIFNGVSPSPVRMKIFSATLGKVLNRPNLLPIPSPILKLLLGDGAKVVLEGQKVMSKRLEKVAFHFKYSELSDALEDITNSNTKKLIKDQLRKN